jgi:hypothetical protein
MTRRPFTQPQRVYRYHAGVRAFDWRKCAGACRLPPCQWDERCPRHTSININACHYVAGRHRAFIVWNIQRPPFCDFVSVTMELERSTGINTRALVAFRPGLRKLQWASTRVTMLQEDIAHSLFEIFCVPLPVIYEEKGQNKLRRLLQEITVHSGDITALYLVGQSSKLQ